GQGAPVWGPTTRRAGPRWSHACSRMAPACGTSRSKWLLSLALPPYKVGAIAESLEQRTARSTVDSGGPAVHDLRRHVSQRSPTMRKRGMDHMDALTSKKRILILGGGFGGVYTARHLEKLCKRRADIEVVLVSRDNFLLMTPLLFEVCSGTLDVRHCSFPIRAFLRTTRIGEALVQGIDLERRVVHLAAEGENHELAYDQLVLALGSRTNKVMIPGSEHAFTFKTLADALLLRNHLIERFERAEVEIDPERKRSLLTFVIIGGGLVGVEL